LNKRYRIIAILSIIVITLLFVGRIHAITIPDFTGTKTGGQSTSKTPILIAREAGLSTRSEIGLREIHNVLQLLREEYIQEVDANKLLSGAVSGMKSYLKFKKRDVSDIRNPISSKRTLEANLRAFGVEYGKILMKHGKTVDEDKLVYAALRGMINVLQKKYNDPYTVAMNPKEFKILQEQLNSKGFSGVGIFIELDKSAGNVLMVVEPVEDTPAFKAGLKPGDHIIRINGVSTRGMSLDVASGRIRGPEGTIVKLGIKRKGIKKPFIVSIRRGNIVVSSLRSEMKGNIGYIKLRFFGETTREEFYKALKEMNNKGAKGLVLDLRNNGGGYINAAVQVCSPFVKPGTVITSVVNYRKGTRDRYEAYPVLRERIPLVVLVNKYSASASEITAGCIQDLKLGALIGTKTFGKGSVQTIHRIMGGGALKYTSAHYLTPKGKDINKRGIDPDIVVKMDPILMGTKKDTQLNRALSYLKAKISRK